MKAWIASGLRAAGLAALFVSTTAGVPTNGVPTNGVPTNGVPTNGVPTNGVPTNGVPTNGLALDAFESTLIFANRTVHEALIGHPFTAQYITDPKSPVFQVWSDPFSSLLLSYLWQDAHASGDDLVFVGPFGNTFHFYGNLGLCDVKGHGWSRDTAQDQTCARWLSAAIITQINQSGIHNLFSARGPTGSATGFIGSQLTDMAPALHSFDYKFGTHNPVEALRDPCPAHTTGPANCGWQPGQMGTGTPGVVVEISVTSLDVPAVPMIVQVNQGIMGHNHPFAPKGSCFGVPGCTSDPDVLGFDVSGAVNPTVRFTVPPSHVFNVQWSTFSRDALASRVTTGTGASAPVIKARIVSGLGRIRFPADELDVFPARNREMTALGNIFGAANIDPALFSCEARPAAAAGAPAYSFLDLAQPQAFGINDAGQVVGGAFDPSFGEHGFLRNADGTVLVFDVISPAGAPAARTEAHDINNSGQIVGEFADGTGLHGFVRNADGSFTTFDAADADVGAQRGSTSARGINDAGQIVGDFLDAGFNSHGFVRTVDGAISSIDVPGASQIFYSGIDSSGTIVGTTVDTAGQHGIIIRGALAPPATFTFVDLLGAAGTELNGINDGGELAGTFHDGTRSHGFVLPAPAFTDGPVGGFTVLDDPAVAPTGDTNANGINNLAAVAGTTLQGDTLTGFVASLAGVQLCSAANTTACIPCTRNFTPGSLHVVFPNAHMWLSRSWNNAQDYYKARSCSSDLSTCIATLEGFIDAAFLNPATGRTVPACLVQNADTDTHSPLPYPPPAQTLHDANFCFVGSTTVPFFDVTTFFPNYRNFGSCGNISATATAACSFTPRRPIPDDDDDD